MNPSRTHTNTVFNLWIYQFVYIYVCVYFCGSSYFQFGISIPISWLLFRYKPQQMRMSCGYNQPKWEKLLTSSWHHIIPLILVYLGYPATKRKPTVTVTGHFVSHAISKSRHLVNCSLACSMGKLANGFGQIGHGITHGPLSLVMMIFTYQKWWCPTLNHQMVPSGKLK